MLSGRTCSSCGSDQYRDGNACHDCHTCTAGQYSAASCPTTSTCSACSPGQYSGSGATSCINCDAGTRQSNSGSSSCIDCPSGQYMGSTGSSASSCITCSAGRYSLATQPSCSSCPAGKRQHSTGQSSCIDCPVGEYMGSTGSSASSCITCELGKWQGSVQSSSCIVCPAGRYVDTTGSTSNCIGCPAADISGASFPAHTSGTAQSWIADDATAAQFHDEASDCTLEAAECTEGTSIANLAIPASNCVDVHRGQSCAIVCGYGYSFTGTHQCTCDESNGVCTLAGGSCVACTELDSCGTGSQHGQDGCECFEDNGASGCRLRPGYCYIDNVCRMDSASSVDFAADALGHVGTPHRVGTSDFSSGWETTHLHFSGNVCYHCDASASTSAWTTYATVSDCLLCDDVGNSEPIDTAVAPGYCSIGYTGPTDLGLCYEVNQLRGELEGVPGWDYSSPPSPDEVLAAAPGHASCQVCNQDSEGFTTSVVPQVAAHTGTTARALVNLLDTTCNDGVITTWRDVCTSGAVCAGTPYDCPPGTCRSGTAAANDGTADCSSCRSHTGGIYLPPGGTSPTDDQGECTVNTNWSASASEPPPPPPPLPCFLKKGVKKKSQTESDQRKQCHVSRTGASSKGRALRTGT